MSPGAENKGEIDLGPNAAASAPDAQTVQLMASLTHEIPKPKDWQAFQRNCVVLFRADLGDPAAQEYGRHGQAQHGIDILGRRNASDDHWVGIQCRRKEEPLSKETILADCRATEALPVSLREIIFATTAPNDTGATNAAIEVEAILRAEGRPVKVTVIGWASLSILIALHPSAYAAFYPAAFASQAPREENLGDFPAALLEEIKALRLQMAEVKTAISIPGDGVEGTVEDEKEEDRALHARIDTYRDLLRNDRQLAAAEKGLKALIGTFDQDAQPRADFRIKLNLGSIALELGREAEAIEYYEQAHAVRPDDPTGIAGLALARTLSGDYRGAMVLAGEALAATPPANHAIAYLLQAAARSDWQGEPESLIPAELAGTPDADLGLAEFWRVREVPDWPQRAIEISRRHPETRVFGRIGAQAVLAMAAQNNRYLAGGNAPVGPEELSEAADELKAAAEHYLQIGFAGKDAIAFVANAAVILRYCGRTGEAEELLTRALAAGLDDSALVRLLGLAQSLNGKREAAIATLAVLTGDGEAMLLSAELIAQADAREALGRLTAIPADMLGSQQKIVRWQLAAELGSGLGDSEAFEGALSELRAIGGQDVIVELLRLHDLHIHGAREVDLATRAREVAASVPPDIDMATRVLVAQELRSFGRPLEASRLLEGHVDLRRMSAGTLLYLQSLAGARRDDAFREALRLAAPVVKDAADVLWLTAAHSWNVGDLAAALTSINGFLAKSPENFRGRLLKIEILARQNRAADLSTELSRPVETLPDAPLDGQLRIVSLLGHFGFIERAAWLAYRLFLAHRDDARVWMALSSTILLEGAERQSRLWQITTAALDAGVDVAFDDGAAQFFVIEADPELLRLDADSREPDHPLAVAVTGKALGEEFIYDGRLGRITQLRHKYVARFHYILEEYERRFPEIVGFRSLKVDPSRPDGLDEIRAQLVKRDKWVREQSQLYESTNWPLVMLALATGTNVIEAAGGLGAIGIKLKVAAGNQMERQITAQAFAKRNPTGCVVDLWTFWTAHRLGALDTLEALCGGIVVAQHSLDELRNHRAKVALSLETGLKTMGLNQGQIQIAEAPPQEVAAWVADIDQAILWIEGHRANRAVVANDDLPDALLEHLQTDASHIFDEVVLALSSDLTLVSDDLVLRQVAAGLGVPCSIWLHWLAGVAATRHLIDFDTYVRWSASLIDSGQGYLGISSLALKAALERDLIDGRDQPGADFMSLASVLGGERADPRSHIVAVLGCMKLIWTDKRFDVIRQKATSHLLLKLICGREDDYKPILRTVAAHVSDNINLLAYLLGWSKGHFVSNAII